MNPLANDPRKQESTNMPVTIKNLTFYYSENEKIVPVNNWRKVSDCAAVYTLYRPEPPSNEIYFRVPTSWAPTPPVYPRPECQK